MRSTPFQCPSSMKKSLVLCAISKSSRFGGREMVRTCSARSVHVSAHNNALTARRLMPVPCFRQKPFIVLQQLNYMFTFGQSSDENDSGSDSDLGAVVEDVYSDSDVEHDSYRRFLYPHSQDPIILKLRDCASVQDVFDIVTQHENELSGQHASQAVLMLWDLQKIYYKIDVEAQNERSYSICGVAVDYTHNIVCHPVFKKIVHCLECTFNELSPDAASCTFLYFRRMGITFENLVMQKLLFQIETLIEKEGNIFPMTALSRFTVALSGSHSVWFFFAVQKAIPLIYGKIGSCENEDDVRLLIICLKNISHIIDSKALNQFICKVEYLLANGVLSTFSSSTIAKTATFLNNCYWTNETANVNRKLLLLLKERISDLKRSDLIRVHKVIQNQWEPADFRAQLSERASHLLLDEENCVPVDNVSFELLKCVASYFPLKERKTLEKLTSDYMKQEMNPNSIASLFQIIRYLKTSDIELCHIFWFKTLEVMKKYPKEYSICGIGKYSNRYMHFNNNLGGTYRNHVFETQIIKWYLHHYETGIIGHIPTKLAHMVSFFVAYFDKQEKDLYNKLEVLIERLCEMSSQLSAKDCETLSRGIQISEQLQNNFFAKPQMFHILTKLNSLLNTLIEKHMQNLDYGLATTNTMMQSYVMRKAPQSTDIFQKLVMRYDAFCGPINSRLLRTAVHNFLPSKCLIPTVVDHLVEYIIQNKIHLFGETMEIILFLCYYLGYVPTNTDTFLEACSEVILRDCEQMPGLSVLQTGLSLCFFHYLPEKLVHRIFSIEFLERLDEEISTCYSKATYPSRVRNYLMQLNRAVCLDFPEYDVPWFHKKYCEEIAATEPGQTSAFYSEIKEILIDILGGKSFVKTDAYSPYGYKIDFEIFLSQYNVPVSWKHRTDKNVSRKAVVLQREDVFSKNVKSLSGFNQMKKRHLEILGYEVIGIEQTIWNSMYMSEPGMKYKFLQDKVLKNECEKICEILR